MLLAIWNCIITKTVIVSFERIRSVKNEGVLLYINRNSYFVWIFMLRVDKMILTYNYYESIVNYTYMSLYSRKYK